MNTPQRDFIYTCPSRIFEDSTITLSEMKIYMLIRSFMDTTGAAFPSNKWLSEKLNIEPRSVRRSISSLVTKGYVERIEIGEKRYLQIKILPILDPTVSQKPEPSIQKNDPKVDQKMDRGGTPMSGGGGHECPERGDINVPILDQRYISSKSIKTLDHLGNDPVIDPKSDPVDYRESDPVNEQKSASETLDQKKERFEEFWKLYPRKVAKKKARDLFVKRSLHRHADEIIADIHRRLSDEWKNAAKEYIPHASTYLNGERWTDEPEKRSTTTQNSNSPKRWTIEEVMNA